MSVEQWKAICDWVTVAALTFTFVAGAGAQITGNIIRMRQEAQLLQFNQELTAAKIELGVQQERAAKAELELRQYIERVENQNLPRHFRFNQGPLLQRLKDKPKGTIELWYSPNDESSWLFALQLRRWLGHGANGDGAGWSVPAPEPRASTAQFAGTGSTLRLTILSRDVPAAAGSTLQALLCGLSESLGGGSLVGEGRRDLPPNTFIIVIGQEP